MHNVLWTVFFHIVPMAMGLVGAYALTRIRRFRLFFLDALKTNSDYAADVLGTAALTCVVAGCASYALARLLLRSFMLGLPRYTQNFTLISAAGFIMIAPMLILFLALQRRFVDGIAASGLGGA